MSAAQLLLAIVAHYRNVSQYINAAISKTPRRYTYSDVSVSDDERDRATPDKMEVEFPRLVVELLSDSTGAYDRGKKFGYYWALPLRIRKVPRGQVAGDTWQSIGQRVACP